MRRIGLAVALTLSLALMPFSARGQPPAKVPRIGFLASPSATFFLTRLNAFQAGLRDLGYVEGKSIIVEYRFAEGKEERLPDLAAELVRLKVDVIVTVGPPAALAAKAATTTIPIIFSAVGDAVSFGLVPSLARPSGNVTGLSLLLPELMGKRLELLKEAVPRVIRVAVLWKPLNTTNLSNLKEMQALAEALGLQLKSAETQSRKDFEVAFETVTRGGAQAMVVVPDPLFNTHHRLIVDFAAKNRLPAIYGTPEFVNAGGLMSFGPSYTDHFRRAATYVDKILKGAKPADLPVEQPTKFELVINLKTAKALGLTIPQSVLLRADQVIE